MELKRMIK